MVVALPLFWNQTGFRADELHQQVTGRGRGAQSESMRCFGEWRNAAVHSISSLPIYPLLSATEIVERAALTVADAT